VGNSSAGIREAPVYCVPTVNVGTRQLNRSNHPSIVNVPENREAILAALRSLPAPTEPSTHFGRGDSARRFLLALSDPGLWETPCQKQFLDLVAPDAGG